MYCKKLIQLKCDGKPIRLSVIESHITDLRVSVDPNNIPMQYNIAVTRENNKLSKNVWLLMKYEYTEY